jgi:uncharacterized protein (TIGR00645 family)
MPCYASVEGDPVSIEELAPFVEVEVPVIAAPDGPDASGWVVHATEALEERVESFLFASRWLLAPLYVGLVGGLLIILLKFGQVFWDLASHAVNDDLKTVTLGLLELLDVTLLANLVLIVIFAGYENFVSKIGAAQDSEDRPHWMGKVDYSGLKMKLIGSIVALSVIGLLQDFLNAGAGGHASVEEWRIAIHMTFLLSGVLFATMDLIAERRHEVELRLEIAHREMRSTEHR